MFVVVVVVVVVLLTCVKSAAAETIILSIHTLPPLMFADAFQYTYNIYCKYRDRQTWTNRMQIWSGPTLFATYPSVFKQITIQ